MGEVDGVADDAELGAVFAAEQRRRHLAGTDADP
jgi:hypothetical protein